MFNMKNLIEKDFFTEISLQAKYLYIYRLFKNGKLEVLYDNSFGKIDKKIFLNKKDIHGLSHKKAFENKRVVYPWFLTGHKACFYETTIIPLSDNLGQVQSLFCIVKQLDGVYQEDKKCLMVADSVGESFTRLLMKVREEEKRQIASAFHDEIGSSVVFLNSLISMLKTDISNKETKKALKKVHELEEEFCRAIQRMRQIIISIRPPQLKDIGLVAAIKDLVDSLQSAAKIKITFNYNVNDKTQISEEIKIILYRCVQESINNVFKHARAKNIWVDLREQNASLLLTIKDDGIGYKEKKSRSVKHIGLLGMRESLTYIGGTFDIQGESKKGTLISIKCPKISYIRKVV